MRHEARQVRIRLGVVQRIEEDDGGDGSNDQAQDDRDIIEDQASFNGHLPSTEPRRHVRHNHVGGQSRINEAEKTPASHRQGS